MPPSVDSEGWFIEKWGEIAQRRGAGLPLSDVDELADVLCWIDYCMCNAGDLANLDDDVLSSGRRLAVLCKLPRTMKLLSSERAAIERAYFKVRDEICAELREAIQ